jgi:hypothetical protein
MTSVIAFDEITTGSEVRFTVINGVQYLSIRDLIMIICEKDNNHACEVWRNFPEDAKADMKDEISTFQFPGKGQSKQPVITFPGAIEMLMQLPNIGRVRQLRSKGTKIIMRYLAGDKSLIKEIEQNAASDAPIAQMARAAIEPDVEQKRKRNIEDLEIEERRARIEKLRADTFKVNEEAQEKRRVRYAHTLENYTSLCPGEEIDDRARMLFRDNYLNMVLTEKQMITNGDTALPINISLVAGDMKCRLSTEQLKKAGKEAARLYFEKYNKAPGKHRQTVQGISMDVNSYMSTDRDLLEEAIRSVIQ